MAHGLTGKFLQDIDWDLFLLGWLRVVQVVPAASAKISVFYIWRRKNENLKFYFPKRGVSVEYREKNCFRSSYYTHAGAE